MLRSDIVRGERASEVERASKSERGQQTVRARTINRRGAKSAEEETTVKPIVPENDRPQGSRALGVL